MKAIAATGGRPHPLAKQGRIVAVVEYRDGAVVDALRQVA
jgi:citrate lyase alpha subunit